MTAIERDRGEAERLWRHTDRIDDRFDLVERALAAIAGRGGGRNLDSDSIDGRKK